MQKFWIEVLIPNNLIISYPIVIIIITVVLLIIMKIKIKKFNKIIITINSMTISLITKMLLIEIIIMEIITIITNPLCD